jgi:hypothetical protein
LVEEPPEEEKIKVLVNEFNILSDYYTENRLFFSEDLARKIDALLKKFIDIWHQSMGIYKGIKTNR